MPRAIDTENNDAKTSGIRHFQLKTRIYKSETCSIPNQLPPNPLHHDNALLSDLLINGTHNLRTQPSGSGGHSTHERTTRHIPAPEELRRKKAANNSPEHCGMPKPKGATAEQKKDPLPPSLSPTCEKNTQQRSRTSCAHAWPLTSAFYPQPTVYRKNLGNTRAL